MKQLTMNMGALSGTETVAPYAEGDILMHKRWGRIVVKGVVRDAEAAHPEVILGLRLDSGSNCITFPSEILYRSR